MKVEIVIDKGIPKKYKAVTIKVCEGELSVYGDEECVGHLTINDLLMCCLEKRFNKVEKELKDML